MPHPIRNIQTEDLPALKQVLDATGLFPSEMLDEMIAGYFQQSDSPEIWFTYLIDDQPVALGYCAPEHFTEGTYNLYAIGILPAHQGKGIGRQMMDHLEDRLRTSGQRILLVETSGSSEFALTREFYLKCGYTQEAVIREFWQEGEDKVIFWKKL